MKKNTYRRTFILASALTAFVVAGCTHMINPPKEPFTAYAGQEKLHLRVGLNITDDLLKAKSEWHRMGDTWLIPIGDSVAANARVLARHAFSDVVDLRNGQLPPNETVAAILTPKVMYINRTVAATALGKSIVSIKVEWTLSDLSGNTIWADTINGESSDSMGFTTAKSEGILKNALEDLLRKSQQAISSAPAIREFARKASQ